MSLPQDQFNPDSFGPAAPSQQAFLKQYVPQDDDNGVVANFENVSEHKPFLSQQAGKDVFADVVFVRITVRGNDKLEVHRPATDADKKRFPFAWQQFQAGVAHGARGLPLDRVPGLEARRIAHLHSVNVFTVEDLALVSDGNLPNLGADGRELRRKAQEIVNSTRTAGETQRMAAVEQDNEALRASNADLLARLERLEAAQAKKK